MTTAQEKIDELRYLVQGGLIKRDVCADRYAKIIGDLNRNGEAAGQVAELNRDIIDCWSESGLRYIKDKAWKIWNEFHEGQ